MQAAVHRRRHLTGNKLFAFSSACTRKSGCSCVGTHVSTRIDTSGLPAPGTNSMEAGKTVALGEDGRSQNHRSQFTENKFFACSSVRTSKSRRSCVGPHVYTRRHTFVSMFRMAWRQRRPAVSEHSSSHEQQSTQTFKWRHIHVQAPSGWLFARSSTKTTQYGSSGLYACGKTVPLSCKTLYRNPTPCL